jgi:hypothetical protein
VKLFSLWMSLALLVATLIALGYRGWRGLAPAAVQRSRGARRYGVRLWFYKGILKEVVIEAPINQRWDFVLRRESLVDRIATLLGAAEDQFCAAMRAGADELDRQFYVDYMPAEVATALLSDRSFSQALLGLHRWVLRGKGKVHRIDAHAGILSVSIFNAGGGVALEEHSVEQIIELQRAGADSKKSSTRQAATESRWACDAR